MLGPPLLSSPFLMILLEGLCRKERLVEFARVRSVLIDCWWARVRARRSELRWRARSSADGGSPKMKNFMKKKIRRAMESWPRRKPWVKDRLCEVSGARRGLDGAVRRAALSCWRRNWGGRWFCHDGVSAAIGWSWRRLRCVCVPARCSQT